VLPEADDGTSYDAKSFVAARRPRPPARPYAPLEGGRSLPLPPLADAPTFRCCRLQTVSREMVPPNPIPGEAIRAIREAAFCLACDPRDRGPPAQDPSKARLDGIRGRARATSSSHRAVMGNSDASRVVAGGFLPVAAGSPLKNWFVAPRAGGRAPARSRRPLPLKPLAPASSGASKPHGLRLNIGEAPIVVNRLLGPPRPPTFRQDGRKT